MRNLIGFALVPFLTFYDSSLCSQAMTFTVNSLADDLNSEPWDNPDTPADETRDGVCEDLAHRCTLRAGLEEAFILESKALASFGMLSGNLVVNDTMGPLSVPDFSVLTGFNQRVILYGMDYNTSVLMQIGMGTQVLGLGFQNGLIGLLVAGDHNLVGAASGLLGNYFNHFSQTGIQLIGNDNNVVANRIGVLFDGTPNGSAFGIFVTGSNNTIGGLIPGEGNLISGNQKGIGVYTLEGSTYIYGNRIGTDSAATQAIPNEVGIDNIGPNVYIGNNTADGMNIISGNSQSGVLMGIDANNCFVSMNAIGTNAAGNIAIPNRDGITLGPGASLCLVENNLISYNTANGILVSGFDFQDLQSDLHVIVGNEITVNGNAGIALIGAANNNIIGSSLGLILAPNQIQFNGTTGILTAQGQGTPQENTFRRNSFQDNTNFGIRILAGQGSIQPPMLTTYTDPGGGVLTLTGTHPLAGALIDVYDGDINQVGLYEGLTWIGEGLVDVSGNFSINIPNCGCDTLVATATDILGNTSEFSDALGIMTTSVSGPGSMPLDVVLTPNPFHDEVHIRFNDEIAGDIRFQVFDISGALISSQSIKNVRDETQSFTWNPGGISPGIYYYRLHTESGREKNGKMVYCPNGSH